MAELVDDRVQTFVRIRPQMKLLNVTERKKNILKFTSKEVFVDGVQNRGPQTFEFDGVFGPNATQEEVFNTVVKPVISDVLLGYSCTILAFGQTGSGKTYTMFGAKPQESVSSWHNEDGAGLIIRTIDNLFRKIPETDRKVSITYLELCNEQLFDLIAQNDDGNSIKIYEDSNKGIIKLVGTTSAQVVSKEEVFRILERGAFCRKSAGTHVEGELSRSHSIITIKVYIKASIMEEEMSISDERLKIGSLILVDLADSNHFSTAGGVNKFERQTATSNQSLLQLGRVITALAEKAQHIPYRSSKLTRILQDSLGGQTKTRIISTVSPSANSLDETLTTLKYCAGARNIVNRPVINTQTNIMNLLRALCEKIRRLTLDLEATIQEDGVYFTEEAYSELCEKSGKKKCECKEKLQRVALLKSEIEMKETQLMELKNVFQEECANLENVQLLITDAKVSLKRLKYKLDKTRLKCKGKQFHVKQLKSNEDKLSEQAKYLMSVCTVVTKDASSLYDKLDRTRCIEEENIKGVKQFKENMLKVFESFEKQFDLEGKLQYLRDHKEFILNTYDKQHSVLLEMIKQIIETLNSLKMTVAEVDAQVENHANSIKKYTDAMSIVMGGSIEKAKKMIRNFHSSVQQALEELMHVTVREAELLTIETKQKINEINRQMDSTISKSSQFQQSLIGLKNSVLSLIDDVMKKLQQCTEETERIMSAIVSKRNHDKAQLMKILEEINKIQQLITNDRVSDVLKDQEKIYINTLSLCSKFKCEAEKLIETTTMTQDVTNSNLTEYQLNLNETINTFHKRFKEIISSSAEQTKEVRTEVNRVSELCNEKCKQYKDKVAENTKKFSCVMNERITNINNGLETVPDELYAECKEKYLNTLTSKKDAVITEYDNNQNNVRLWQHQTTNYISQFNTTIHELTNLKTYVPTGDTPERKEYKFPTLITESMSPRTIIKSEISDVDDKLLEEIKE